MASIDGAVRRVAIKDLFDALNEQNAIRAQEGLAPLPDPFTVTTANPAVAGQ